MNEEQAPQGGADAPQPSEEELRAALEEQLRKVTVSDILLQTSVTLVNIGARRLGLAGGEDAEEDRDLDQARLAIEALRALLPLLEGEEAAPVKDALSQLQLAYAKAAGGGAAPEGDGEGEETAGEKPPKPGAGESKIWTPPGS